MTMAFLEAAAGCVYVERVLRQVSPTFCGLILTSVNNWRPHSVNAGSTGYSCWQRKAPMALSLKSFLFQICCFAASCFAASRLPSNICIPGGQGWEGGAAVPLVVLLLTMCPSLWTESSPDPPNIQNPTPKPDPRRRQPAAPGRRRGKSYIAWQAQIRRHDIVRGVRCASRLRLSGVSRRRAVVYGSGSALPFAHTNSGALVPWCSTPTLLSPGLTLGIQGFRPPIRTACAPIPDRYPTVWRCLGLRCHMYARSMQRSTQ